MSSSGAGGERALAWAEQAHALVQVQPRSALALAERAVAAAAEAGDAEAEVVARQALGWAQKVLGDARTGRSTLRAGIRLAQKHGDRRGLGILRRSLAVSYAHAGEAHAAEREIAAALALLSGLDRARSQVHRIEVYRKASSPDPRQSRAVFSDAAEALRRLRREHDELWEARLLFNRGALHSDRGEFVQAERDLRRAQMLYAQAGAEAAAADAAVVVAELAQRRGEIVSCLEALDQAQTTAAVYNRENVLELRVVALAEARLLPEASAAARAYVDLCTRTKRGDVASALLELARIELLSGDAGSAERSALRAARSFRARDKPLNAALARVVCLRARLRAGDVRPSSVQSALDAAAALGEAGWRREALRARLLAGRLALAADRPATARRDIESARSLSTRGTVTDRVELSHAQALLRLAEGQTRAAEQLLDRGLQLLDEHRAALGASELRAVATGIGAELALEGLRLALESGRPKSILSWAERLRGNALRMAPVRPPADRELGDLQARLRDAVAKGHVTDQTRLESAIRSRSRALRGRGDDPAPALDLDRATAALGRRALVEYVEVDGLLCAVTLLGAELASHELDGNATTELEWLRFAYARLAAGRLNAEQRAANRRNAEMSARALETALVAPLLPALGDAPLAIIPTGALHALPWSALPALRARPLVVASSLTTWTTLAGRTRSRRRSAAFVAGPRLRHAAAEVRELGVLRPAATVLTGKAATAEATLAALDGAALAHLACHGHFRADSPLFSSLELADGPLNVYELQNLKRAPEIVVLSACDLALSQLHPGDELLGLAAALIGMGTRTVIASVVPVPDAESRRVMLDFHRRLAAGNRPAEALAHAQARARVPGFICLGSG